MVAENKEQKTTKKKQSVEEKSKPSTEEKKSVKTLKSRFDMRAKENHKMTVGALLGWAFLMALWVGVVLIGVQYALAYLISAMHLQVSEIVLQTIFSALVYVVALLVIIFVPWKLLKMKTTREELGMRGLPTWTDILLAPIAFIVFLIASGFIMAVMQAIMPSIDWTQEQDVGFNNIISNLDFVLTFLSLVVIAPIAEEIIFRGWLYGKMRRKMSAVPAILIVSLLFGLVHGQWNVGVVVFTMSIAMCLIRELTGTIWGGILVHMIKNGLAFYALYVNPGLFGAISGMLILAL
jgi:membrane protease YdiL (CAAX protease family)